METVCVVSIIEPVTVNIVRDALSSCFNQVHCSNTGLEGADSKTLNSYCVEIVKKTFSDLGLDYQHPTKEDLIKANDALTNFAKKFHDEKTIQEYSGKITGLISRLS